MENNPWQRRQKAVKQQAGAATEASLPFPLPQTGYNLVASAAHAQGGASFLSKPMQPHPELF